MAGLTGVPRNERMRDVINVGYLLARNQSPQAGPATLTKDYWADISQSVHLKPFMKGLCPTFTTISLMYSYEHDILLSPHATLQLLGWPARYGLAVTQHELRRLVGEAASVPEMTQAMYAFYLNPWAKWWH